MSDDPDIPPEVPENPPPGASPADKPADALPTADGPPAEEPLPSGLRDPDEDSLRLAEALVFASATPERRKSTSARKPSMPSDRMFERVALRKGPPRSCT